MEIKYQLYEEEHLLIQRYSGQFSFEKYFKFSHHIIQTYVPKKVIKKVLLDLRDLQLGKLEDEIPVEFEEDLERVIEIRKKFKENQLKNKEFKSVIWVDKPQSTVIAHLFMQRFPAGDYDYCSTAPIAIELLKLPSRFDNLEQIIEDLEHTF